MEFAWYFHQIWQIREYWADNLWTLLQQLFSMINVQVLGPRKDTDPLGLAKMTCGCSSTSTQELTQGNSLPVHANYLDEWTCEQGSHFFPLTNFPDFYQHFFHFSLTFIKYFYGFYSILSTCTKILFLQYPEVRIFTLLHPKYSHKTQIIQHLTHFRPAPGMEWFIHYPKKGFLK